MNNPQSNPGSTREVEQLLQRMCDGTISAEERDRLEQVLLSDATARKLYVEFSSVHAALNWKYRTGDGPTPDSTADAGDQARLSVNTGREQSKNWLRFAAQSLAVAVSIAAAFVVWHLLAPEADRVALSPHSLDERPTFVATLRDATGPVWNNESTAVNVGARIRIGDLRIESGEAELVFDSGAKLLVAGPAELKLKSALAAFVSQGTLAAHMPPTAVGFEIQTPTSKLIDQGTEFGVQVDDKGTTQVHVFRGQVDVEVGGSDGEKPQQVLPLYDRQARRIDRMGDAGEGIAFSRVPFGRLARRVVEPIEWPEAEGGNGHCYQLVIEKQPISWHEAARAAMNLHFRGMPGHLVTLSSAEEDRFVIDRIVDPDKPRGAWIGLTDVLREGHFRWITGEPYAFSNWASWPDPQPDNFQEAEWHGGEDYGMYTQFLDKQPWAWNDLSIDSVHETVSAYVVEYEGPVADLEHRSMVLDPIHWSASEGGNGHYYRVVLVLEPRDWATIKQLAEQTEVLGAKGHLVAMETAAERTFVADHILRVCGIPELMIGLSGSLEQNDLRWVTGEPVTGFEVERSHLPTDQAYGLFRWNPAGKWQAGWEISAMSVDILPANWFGYIVEYPVEP